MINIVLSKVKPKIAGFYFMSRPRDTAPFLFRLDTNELSGHDVVAPGIICGKLANLPKGTLFSSKIEFCV